MKKYIKLIGFLLILISSFAAVFDILSRAAKRVAFLKEMSGIAERISARITLSNATVGEILEEFSKGGGITAALFLKMKKEFEESLNLKEAFLKSADMRIVKKEDIRIMSELFSALGTTDTEGQKKVLDTAVKLILKQADEAESEKKTDVKNKCIGLIFLGFAVGLMLV